MSFDPATVEGQGLLGDRTATSAKQFAALRFFKIPVADLCHRGGGACGALLRNGVASLRNAAELVACDLRASSAVNSATEPSVRRLLLPSAFRYWMM